MGRPQASLEEYKDRFFSKVRKTKGCWIWTAAKHPDRYGAFYFRKKQIKAHRFSFLIKNGNLTSGLVIDHICRNKSCVNPNHLRQVTIRQNCLENSNALCAINFLKSHCPKGHPYDKNNTCNSNGRRKCRMCGAIYMRNKRNKK